MEAFLTGSHAYGQPNEDSDVDIVIYPDENLRFFLQEMYAKPGHPVRVGELNIIMPTDEVEWAIWKVGTAILTRMTEGGTKSIDKFKAKEVFDSVRSQTGRLDYYAEQQRKEKRNK